jgi:DNA-binding NtrC family response regulator
MNRMSLLVADDEEAIRELLKLWLEAEGHTVLCVENARESAKLLKRVKFDLVITDVLMPDGDGLQLITELKAAQPMVRVLAISGGGRYMEGGDCLKMARGLGANAAVMKPFTRDQLFAGMELALAPAARART